MRRAGDKLGYMLGISKNERPYEAPLPTNAGDFQAFIEGLAVGARFPRERRSKLAGDAFNLDLATSTGNPPTLPPPYVGGAELRNLDIVI